MVTHACKPGTLEAEDRLLHSKTLDRHPRKRREKGQKKERDQKEIRRKKGGRREIQSRGTCVQTTYLGRNLHLEYIKNSFKNIEKWARDSQIYTKMIYKCPIHT